MEKTIDYKQFEGLSEEKFQNLKKSLNSLYYEVPQKVAIDVIEKILPYVIELRSESTSLKLELQKQKELKDELVNLFENILCFDEFLKLYPETAKDIESLIKKSNEI